MDELLFRRNSKSTEGGEHEIMTAQFKKRSGGFTLIELLIVIAILGVLAVVVLISINPVQQLARTRDAGRKSSITQLGHALEAYAVTNNGTYVAEAATWVTTLVNAGELSVVPSAITYSVATTGPCTENAQNGWCYDATTAGGGEPVVTYARLESDSENSPCTAPQVAFFAWSTADGRGGVVCAATTGLDPGNQTFQ